MILGFTLISSIIFGLNTPLVNRHVSSFSFHCVRKTSRLKLNLIFSRSLSSIFGFVSTMTSSNANHLLLITYQQNEIETDKLFKNCFRNLLQSPAGQCRLSCPVVLKKWNSDSSENSLTESRNLYWVICQRRQLKNSAVFKKDM